MALYETKTINRLVKNATGHRAALLMLCLVVCAVFAIQLRSGNGYAAPLSYGYATADKSLVVGMAAGYVTPSSGQEKQVESALSSTPAQFAGIVSGTRVQGQTTEAYVVTSGSVEAYVSSANGTVHQGDSLTISPLKGILMRSSTSTESIVGTALANLPTQGTTSRQIQQTNGTQQTVQLAEIPINLSSKATNTIQTQPARSILSNLVDKSNDKFTNTLRVIGALALFFTVLVIEGMLIYSAVSGSIASAGRNPLAKDSIYRTLGRVFLLAVVVLAFGLGAIYVILVV